jgi:hypothetical protein
VILLVPLLPLLAQDVALRVKETAYARAARARAIARDPELLKAVVAKNEAREGSDEIQRKDKQWMDNPQYPLRKELTQNTCAIRLQKLIADDPLIVEAILMDAQGANVCASRETSDYWQGDEAKWLKTYSEGKPVFVDEPAFDASTGTYAIQLSVPVLAGERRVGALTLTLKLNRAHLTKQ